MSSSLHGHSCYSDGLNTPQEIVSCAEELGMHSIAITDHGTMAGTFMSIIQMSKPGKCRVIAGMEAYHSLWNKSVTEIREGKKKGDISKNIFHITLIALNDVGYKNLCKMNYYAWKSFYRYPLCDLSSFSGKGIACLTGCPSSYFSFSLMRDDFAEAERWLSFLISKFDYVAIEIMGGSDIHSLYDRKAMDVARKYNLDVIATKDYHYCYSKDKKLYDAFCLAKNKPPIQGDFSIDLDMNTICGKEGIDNAIKLASQINYSQVKFSPLRDLKKESDLWDLVFKKASSFGSEYLERARKEVEVISDIGMGWYIHELYSICQNLREMGILYEARGSASGSLVCYLLGITCIDPIRYGMLFERFMSRSRREVPDIDLDVPSESRGKIIDFLKEKYTVSKIITSSYVGENSARNCVQRIKEKDPSADIDPSSLVGRVYNTGVHASGIILLPKDYDFSIPLRHKDGWDILEFEFDYIPFVKWDLLGQKNLDVLVDVYKSIHKNDSEMSNYYFWRDSIVENDKLISSSMLNAYVSGTPGIFQLEGSMTGFFLKGIYLTVDDLAKLVAIYRPAVLSSGFIQDIVTGSNLDPVIANLCRSGYPIYQEDLMRILVHIGNFSMEDAYTVIKKASKKDREVLSEIRGRIKDNLSNYSEDRVQKIIELVEAFFGYGFNVAHAVAYALRMAVTAYLKYKHPKEYFECLLNRENDPVSILSYLTHLQQVYGYKILPHLKRGFSISKDIVYVGIDSVKRVSEKDVDILSDIWDSSVSIIEFSCKCAEKKINAQTIEALDSTLITKLLWGREVKSYYDIARYNLNHKRKKKPMYEDSLRSDKISMDIDIETLDKVLSDTGVILYTLPLPKFRCCSSYRFNSVGIFYRKSDNYTFIDTIGETYTLKGFSSEKSCGILTGVPMRRFGSVVEVVEEEDGGNLA